MIASFVERTVSTVCLRVLLALLLAVGCVTGLASSQTARAVDAFAPGQRVSVDKDALNVRSVPGLDGSIREVLSFGAVLAIDGAPVFADGYDWYKVQDNNAVQVNDGPTGWVAGEFLAAAGWFVATQLQVVDGPLNLRAAADIGSDVIEQLADGLRVTTTSAPIVNGGHTWYQVYVNRWGDRGYVAGEFLGFPDVGLERGNTAVVSDGPLNLRSDAGLSNAILGVLPSGVELTITGDPVVSVDGYLWMSVHSADEGDGWVAREFI